MDFKLETNRKEWKKNYWTLLTTPEFHVLDREFPTIQIQTFWEKSNIFWMSKFLINFWSIFWGYLPFWQAFDCSVKARTPSAEFFREPRAGLKNTSVVTMKVVMIIEAKIKLAEQSPPSNFDSGLASTFEWHFAYPLTCIMIIFMMILMMNSVMMVMFNMFMIDQYDGNDDVHHPLHLFLSHPIKPFTCHNFLS